jgi:hypothetical protein
MFFCSRGPRTVIGHLSMHIIYSLLQLSIFLINLSLFFECEHALFLAGFLCPMSANTYGIEFLQFAIVDYDSKNCLFEVGKDIPPPADMSLDFSSTGEDVYRKIRYNFSEDVLTLPFIQTKLVLFFYALNHSWVG